MPEAKHNQDEKRKTFEELARDLGCDESEERFEEVVRKIAPKDSDAAKRGEAEIGRRLRDRD